MSWVAGRPTKTQRVYGILNKSLRVFSGQGVGWDGYWPLVGGHPTYGVKKGRAIYRKVGMSSSIRKNYCNIKGKISFGRRNLTPVSHGCSNHWFTGGSVARTVENQLLWRQSYRTSNGDLLDIFKKKKQGKCNERKNSSSYYLKNKQTHKQNKEKQNKSLVSISNDGDQLWLSLVLNRSQASADLQCQVLLWYVGQKSQAKWCNNERSFPLEPELCYGKHRYFITGLIKLRSRWPHFPSARGT